MLKGLQLVIIFITDESLIVYVVSKCSVSPSRSLLFAFSVQANSRNSICTKRHGRAHLSSWNQQFTYQKLQPIYFTMVCSEWAVVSVVVWVLYLWKTSKLVSAWWWCIFIAHFSLFSINLLQAKGFVRHILCHGSSYSQTLQKETCTNNLEKREREGETTRGGELVYHHFSSFWSFITRKMWVNLSEQKRQMRAKWTWHIKTAKETLRHICPNPSHISFQPSFITV